MKSALKISSMVLSVVFIAIAPRALAMCHLNDHDPPSILSPLILKIILEKPNSSKGLLSYDSIKEFHRRNNDCCFLEIPDKYQSRVIGQAPAGDVIFIIYRKYIDGYAPFYIRYFNIYKCTKIIGDEGRALSSEERLRLIKQNNIRRLK